MNIMCPYNKIMYHKCSCPDPVSCKTMGSKWASWLPKVFCISLNERDDRMKLASEEFHKVGLCSLVEFYRPIKDTSSVPRPATRGCWESHRAVASRAMATGLSHVLITEDDLVWSHNAKLDNLKSIFQELPKDWEIFYLGHMPLFGYPVRLDLKLWRTWSGCTHCYVINKNVMKWMKNHPYDDEPIKESMIWNKNIGQKGIDDFIRRLFVQYSLFPMISYQRGIQTTNPKNIIPLGNTVQGILNPTGHKVVEIMMVVVFITIIAIIIVIIVIIVRLQSLPATKNP